MRKFRPVVWGVGVFVGAMLMCGAPVARAVPPGAAVGSALPKARWIKHRVIPGERLREIGERYAVSVSSLIRWNKLDPDAPMLRAGSHIRVHTRLDRPAREKITYKVRRGDTWARIAKRHGVRTSHLRRRWNPKLATLKPGDRIAIFVDGEDGKDTSERIHRKRSGGKPAFVALAKRSDGDDDAFSLEQAEPTVPQDFLGAEAAAVGMPIVPVPSTSRSVGRPSAGRIRRPLPLPVNPVLYSIRSPAHAYATSHTIFNLQMAIAKWRARTGYGRELVIMDISKQGGGRLRPHRSHRSGRDVDIRLPLAPGVPDGTVPVQADQVDWDAAWDLVHALIETDQIVYIFLTRSRQVRLRAAAVRAGASDAFLAEHIQYPARERMQTVRHARGHTKHIHVRFKCAPDAERCRD